jgi:two-component system cell cycle sensor histidine kinase/response regulator CckA
VQNLAEGLAVIDGSARIQFANPAAERIFGVAAGGLAGISVTDFLCEKQAARILAEIGQGHARGEVADSLEVKGLDGLQRTIEYSASPQFDHERNFTVSLVAIRDITGQRKAEREVKQLQEQLLQAQKMEAIGRLAGGVAHDFNNLLSIILGNVELIRTKPTSPRDIKDIAQEIQKAGLRAAELTHQLLAFSCKQMLQPKILDLNELVEDLSKMLRRLIGEDITLELRLSPDTGNLKADPGQIEQVMLNLAVNARDAMSAGGKLVLETRNATIDEGLAPGHFDIPSGRYVVLVVSDNGIGMDERGKAHLFEPFGDHPTALRGSAKAARRNGEDTPRRG